MITRLDDGALTLVQGGMRWEQFRQSDNVEDHRDRYSASEDGTLYDNYTGRTMADPTINQDLGGWRDDQETGNRTWIGPDGESDTVERPDGTVTPAPSVWDEARPYNEGTSPPNDFNFGQFSGGDDGGSQGTGGQGEDGGGYGASGSSGGSEDSGGYGGGYDAGGYEGGGGESE